MSNVILPFPAINDMPPSDKSAPSEVDNILDEAWQTQFDEIIVIGFKKDGEITTHHSHTVSRTRLIGALTMVQHRLLHDED